jgi:hypothetical protein
MPGPTNLDEIGRNHHARFGAQDIAVTPHSGTSVMASTVSKLHLTLLLLPRRLGFGCSAASGGSRTPLLLCLAALLKQLCDTQMPIGKSAEMPHVRFLRPAFTWLVGWRPTRGLSTELPRQWITTRPTNCGGRGSDLDGRQRLDAVHDEQSRRSEVVAE